MKLLVLYLLFRLLLTLGFATLADGLPNSRGYVITTPRQWTCYKRVELCAALNAGTFQAGDNLTAILSEATRYNAAARISQVVLTFTEGGFNECVLLSVPKTKFPEATLSLTGTLGGHNIDEEVNVTVVDRSVKTFIQTDKYLYHPGQIVQFRILTLKGSVQNVSTENYEEVFVEFPPGTRISQWLNVDNSKGLVNLEFNLSKECDEGSYKIVAKTGDNLFVRRSFTVEKLYVIPRYEVTVEPLKYVLGSDKTVTLKVCARDTYGDPVKGNITLSLANGAWEPFANISRSKLITSSCENFTFETRELFFDENDCHIRPYQLMARARVVEHGTGVELFASNDAITVHRRVVQFMGETLRVTKPFVPFPVKIKAVYPDDTPARNEAMEVCSIYENEKRCSNFTTSDLGYLEFIMTDSDIFEDKIEITALGYPQIESCSYEAMELSVFNMHLRQYERYFDPTNSSLTITDGAELECNLNQTINVTIPVIYFVNSIPFGDIFIKVLSRGRVQYMNKVNIDFQQTELPIREEDVFLKLEPVPEGIVSGSFKIPMTLPSTVSKKIKVLLWFTTDKGVIVADSRDIEVPDCLPLSSGKPGFEAALRLQRANGSLACSLGGKINQTDLLSIADILLLIDQTQDTKLSNNQLNLEYCLRKDNHTLIEAAAQLNYVSDEPSYHRSKIEALHMFDRTGYHVLSNLALEQHFCGQMITNAFKHVNSPKEQYFQGLPAPITFSGPPIPYGFEGGGPAQDMEDGVEDPKETDYLHDRWLWHLTSLSLKGESEGTLSLADTLTQWVDPTICDHSAAGVEILSDLPLPASIKRGALFPLRLSIFNNLAEDLPVLLIIKESPNYEFVSDGGPVEAGVKSMCIPAKKSFTQTIQMKFKSLGDISIAVKVTSDTSNAYICGSGTPTTVMNTLKIQLTVEPEGMLREKTWNQLVCSSDIVDPSIPIDTWNIESPPHAVEGSDRAWLTVIGDLKTPLITHADSFQYYVWTAIMLRDGSHNIFEEDESLSTWTAAMTLRSFALPKPYISINQLILKQGVDFLKKLQQVENGCFKALGRGISKVVPDEIVSFGNPEFLLSSYVLSAILEGGATPLSPELAISCIKNDNSTHPYSLAMRAYSLTLAGAPSAKTVIDQLLGIAVKNSSFMRWSFEMQDAEQQKGLEIETAAYALLALVRDTTENRTIDAKKVARWLRSQLNEQGLFPSTVDLFVAPQALLAFEKVHLQGHLNLSILAVVGRDKTEISVSEENKSLQQRHDFSVPSTVEIFLHGSGCALIQGVLRYNVLADAPTEAFILTVNTTAASPSACKSRRISACTFNTLSGSVATSVTVIEFTLVSGFIALEEDLEKIVVDESGVFKRFEVEESKVRFYVKGDAKDQICVAFDVHQAVKIGSVELGSVSVYNYYQPEHNSTQNYTFPFVEDCNVTAPTEAGHVEI